jgi:type II secretory pathway pseudopilin PulG
MVTRQQVALLIIAAGLVDSSSVQAQRQAYTSSPHQTARAASERQSAVRTAARPVAAAASGAGMQKAMTAFAMDVGRMPTAAEGLNALLYPPPGVKNWRGPYISSNNWQAPFTDPWGSQYRYVVQGTGRQAIHYIISNGPDRQPSTRDDLTVQF